MDEKGVPLKKDVETIYKLALDKSFRKDIREVRRRAGLPVEGAVDGVPYTNIGEPLLVLAVELLNRYKVSVAYYRAMIHFICFNRFSTDADPELAVLNIKYPNERGHGMERTLKKLKQPYVGLYVLDASSKEDVIKLIRKHWRDIEASLRAQGGSVSRIRTSQNKERNYLISCLYEENWQMLCERLGIKRSDPSYSLPKENLVAQVMEYELGYEVSPEMVKKYSAKPTGKKPTDKSRVKRIRPKKQ